jgi:hypothetical protein
MAAIATLPASSRRGAGSSPQGRLIQIKDDNL